MSRARRPERKNQSLCGIGEDSGRAGAPALRLIFSVSELRTAFRMVRRVAATDGYTGIELPPKVRMARDGESVMTAGRLETAS